MSKIGTRTYDLLLELLKEHPSNAKTLARRVGVNLREIYRELQDFRDRGVKFEEGLKRGMYQISRDAEIFEVVLKREMRSNPVSLDPIPTAEKTQNDRHTEDNLATIKMTKHGEKLFTKVFDEDAPTMIEKFVEGLQGAMPPLNITLNPTNVEYSPVVGMVPTEEEYERTKKALKGLSIAEVRKGFPMKDFPFRNWMALEYLSVDTTFLQELKEVLQLFDSMNLDEFKTIPADIKKTLTDIISDIPIYFQDSDCSEEVKSLHEEIENLQSSFVNLGFEEMEDRMFDDEDAKRL